MNAFKSFNRSYLQHLPNRVKLLTELTCFLKSTPEQFVIGNTADNLDIVAFYRNLNDLLHTDDTNYDFQWAVFQVIAIAIKNKSTRQYLIDTVRIITGVSHFAVKASPFIAEDKQILVWKLIEDITIGINISAEEPHFTNLIDYLVTAITKAHPHMTIKSIHVSILTSLCFTNPIAVACLLRFTRSKHLLNHIKDHRILSCKMAIAMAWFDGSMFESELVMNMKYVFDVEYFVGLMRFKDQRLLSHTSEWLNVGFERDEHSKHIMQQFDFKEAIDGVLTFIDMENSVQDSELIRLFLGIVNSILTVSNTSLESSIPRLLQLAIGSCTTTYISSESIKTIRLIASTVDVGEAPDLVVLINRLIENIDAHHSNLLVASEIYQLLTTLNARHPTIIKQLPSEIINKSIDADHWSLKLTDYNLSMQMYRLQWFLTYTSEDNKWHQKLREVTKKKDVHHIFASGLKNSNEEICALTMLLIRSNHFPLQSVSKLLSAPFVSNLPMATVEIARPCFSVALEKRVNLAVDQLMLKMKDENSSVGIYEHTNMLEYQNTVADSKEKLLQSQLQASNDMITLQSNEIGGLRLIIRNCQNKISELESKISNSRKTVEKMKTGYDSLKEKYDSEKIKVNNLTKTCDELQMERTRLTARKKQFDQDIYDLKSQHEKDRDALAASLLQLKKDHDREKLELAAEYGKDLESHLVKLNTQHEREKEELKSEHGKDLLNYSAKRTQMKTSYEREKTELISRHTKEQTNHLLKIEQFENDLAEKVKQIEKYTREIAEKNQTLDETLKELEKHKRNADIIAELINKR